MILSQYDFELPAREWKLLIARRLVALRQRNKIRQADVTKAMGWKSRAISDYENGRSFPGLRRLGELAVFYDCSIDFLVLGLGWGGIPLIDFEELIHTKLVPKEPAAPKPRGKGIKVKKEPTTPREIKLRKPKAVDLAPATPPASIKKVTRKSRRKSGMSFDFTL